MMKKTTVAAAMLFALCANVHAASNQGSGEVNFVGSIIDAPCSITPESANQTVNMGQIANKTLELYSESAPVNFDIKLEGCALETVKSVNVTFLGAAENATKDQLQIEGSAAGAAISMKNVQSGETIVLGKATKIDTLTDGNNTLKFNAKLVRTGAVDDMDDIKPGDFTATTDFQLSYQ